MPELPEVETVVRTLRPHLVGKTVEDVHVCWHRTIGEYPIDRFHDRFLGRSIVSVQRRGKYIVFGLDNDDRLTVHLRMTGVLQYVAAEAVDPPKLKHLRVALEFADGSRLDFDDVRKFGRMQLLTPDEWQDFDTNLGVEPLKPDFTPEVLYTILQSRCRQLKPLLLDQSVIVGVGNIYADEALFRARLNPQQVSDRISKAKSRDLHEAIVDVLGSAIQHRGTTLQNYRSGLGDAGENQDRLQIYGSAAGTPCPRCGTPIKKITVGQRSTVYCPRCQRKR